MKQCIYLAGPMSHLPQFNFPLFESVARSLRADGYTIVSPHECDNATTQAAAWASPDGNPNTTGAESWGDCLARDVKMLADGVEVEEEQETGGWVLKIDAIAFLPNWEKSRGARLEAFVGLLTGKGFYVVDGYRSGPTQDIEYYLAHRSSEWVQHMLAKDWDGVRLYAAANRPMRGAPV